MSDWVSGSPRMKWIAGASMATWFAGVSLALFAPEGSTTAGAAAAVITICAFAISGSIVIWSAARLQGAGWLQRVWALIALGLAVGTAGVALTIVSQLMAGSKASPFAGALSITAYGYPPIILGAWYAAYSMRAIPDRRGALLRAGVLPVALYLLLLGAMLGPGPAMPFSIGPRDYSAIARLTVDLFLVFLPAVYCIAASLQLPHAHRARTWLWLAIGALMWSMADVVIPLVDTRYGPVYPLMLWALGLHLTAMGASLTVDFHQAAEHPGADPSQALALSDAGAAGR